MNLLNENKTFKNEMTSPGFNNENFELIVDQGLIETGVGPRKKYRTEIMIIHQ